MSITKLIFFTNKEKEISNILSYQKNPLILGGYGYWFVDNKKNIKKFLTVYLNKIKELSKIIENKNDFKIYSAVTHIETRSLSSHYRSFYKKFGEGGSAQVQSSGTVCQRVTQV